GGSLPRVASPPASSFEGSLTAEIASAVTLTLGRAALIAGPGSLTVRTPCSVPTAVKDLAKPKARPTDLSRPGWTAQVWPESELRRTPAPRVPASTSPGLAGLKAIESTACPGSRRTGAQDLPPSRLR